MFDELRKRVEFFKNLDQTKVLYEILNSNPKVQKQIIALNTKNQLFDRGVNTDEEIIGFYKSSKGSKQAGTPYNFKDTGAFLKSFKFEALQEATNLFELEADGQKRDDNLFKKYGDNLLGLTEANKGVVPNLVLPLIQDYLTNKMP